MMRTVFETERQTRNRLAREQASRDRNRAKFRETGYVDWLKKATAYPSKGRHNRPILSLAHKIDLGADSYMASADGYRVHLMHLDPGVPHTDRITYHHSAPDPLGQFPDVGVVIPRRWEGFFSVDVQLLTSAVKRAQVFCRDSSQSCHLAFQDDTLAITGKSPETGDCTTELEAKGPGQLDIWLNAQYLLDALKAWRHEQFVTLHFVSGNVPILLGDMDTYAALIMPMSGPKVPLDPYRPAPAPQPKAATPGVRTLYNQGGITVIVRV